MITVHPEGNEHMYHISWQSIQNYNQNCQPLTGWLTSQSHSTISAKTTTNCGLNMTTDSETLFNLNIYQQRFSATHQADSLAVAKCLWMLFSSTKCHHVQPIRGEWHWLDQIWFNCWPHKYTNTKIYLHGTKWTKETNTHTVFSLSLVIHLTLPVVLAVNTDLFFFSAKLHCSRAAL